MKYTILRILLRLKDKYNHPSLIFRHFCNSHMQTLYQKLQKSLQSVPHGYVTDGLMSDYHENME